MFLYSFSFVLPCLPSCAGFLSIHFFYIPFDPFPLFSALLYSLHCSVTIAPSVIHGFKLCYWNFCCWCYLCSLCKCTMTEALPKNPPAGNRSGVVWKHGITAPVNPRNIQCMYCQKIITGGAYRLKHHLVGTQKNCGTM